MSVLSSHGGEAFANQNYKKCHLKTHHGNETKKKKRKLTFKFNLNPVQKVRH